MRSETKTPGRLAKHMIIRDGCRELHGDNGAIQEALKKLEEAALFCINGWPPGNGHQFHFVLTVEDGRK